MIIFREEQMVFEHDKRRSRFVLKSQHKSLVVPTDLAEKAMEAKPSSLPSYLRGLLNEAPLLSNPQTATV
jgi:hypothetical protein